MQQKSKLDYLSLLLFFLLLAIGFFSIYSSEYNGGAINYANGKQVKQAIWIGISLLIGFFLILLSNSFFQVFSIPIYLLTILLLLLVLFIGAEVAGSRSWISIGPIKLQPAEFAKYGTSLMLASVISKHGFSLKNLRDLVFVILVVAVPFVLIMLQGDTGSASVYLSYYIPMFLMGLSGRYFIYAILGILTFILTIRFGFIYIAASIFLVWMIFSFLNLPRRGNLFYGVVFLLLFLGLSFVSESIVNQVLKPHQKSRVEVLLGLKQDRFGAGYNVFHSKTAIGSGGLFGKGYLKGTHNKGDFVPEQSTDFIFTSFAEEFGWLGSTGLILLFGAMITRIFLLSSRFEDKFPRVFSYCVASILLYHVLINLSMTVGLFPVIGIPLPLMSYGGSSVLAFGLMFFTYLNFSRTSFYRNK